MSDSYEFATVVELLQHQAAARGSAHGYRFLVDGESEHEFLSFVELDRRARTLSRSLLGHAKPGDRVLVLYPPGLEYLVALFGCLYARIVAVPAYPIRPNRPDRRLQGIVRDCQPRIALASDSLVSQQELLAAQSDAYRSLQWLSIDDAGSGDLNGDQIRMPSGSDLAVLQYTSGTTSAPRGVMLSHEHLMENTGLINRAFELSVEQNGVFWLPPYHDMGLIGGLLTKLHCGGDTTWMAPAAFIQKPVRWLQTISRYHSHISGGPNFAYDLCVERISDQQCEDLDLSSWELAFTGAEPVSSDTLDRFARKFAPCGFQPEAFYPCYGLAEATLMVTGGRRMHPVKTLDIQREPFEADQAIVPCTNSEPRRRLVACGQPFQNHRVRIVDPTTCLPIESGRVGEILVAGPSVAGGYWHERNESAPAKFNGRIPGEDACYLRTGDLGFFHEGELYVTGRMDDLIVVRGRNLYARDIEQVVQQSHSALQPIGGAVFTIDGEAGTEVVALHEMARGNRGANHQEIVDAIRRAVADDFGLELASIVIAKPSSLPKTPSGKVQRARCRHRFINGDLSLVFRWPDAPSENGTAPAAAPESLPCDLPDKQTPANHETIRSWLIGKIARHINVAEDQIDAQRRFTHYGLDSITLLTWTGELEKWTGRTISPMLLYDDSTIDDFAARVADPRQATESDAEFQIAAMTGGSLAEREASCLGTAAEKRSHTRGATAGQSSDAPSCYPLSHGQQALWFLHQLDRDSTAYNIYYAAYVRQDVSRDALQRAFESIVDRHAILRTTYGTRNGTAVQFVHKHGQVDVEEIDATTYNRVELERRIRVESSRPFDLQEGPVLRVQLFQRQGDHPLLLVTAHHIAQDFWSFEVLINELEVLYRQQVTGQSASLEPPAIQYADYVDWQERMLAGKYGERLWEYWKQQLSGDLPNLDLPTDRPRPPRQSFGGASVKFAVSDEVASGLSALARTLGATQYATVLAAFQLLLYRYSGQQEILVGSPTLGRNRPELEDSLGYFANPIVLRARMSPQMSFAELLDQVRTTSVGGLKNQDYPFGLLVEKLAPPRDASRSPVFQVAFDWFKPRRNPHNGSIEGTTGSAAHTDEGSLMLESFAVGQQGAAFDLSLNMLDLGESLSGALQYNSDLFDESTAARMVQHFETLLQGIVADPHRALAQLPLLADDERQTQLVDWNDTAAEVPSKKCLHELFEQQVARVPDAVCVECQGEQLTYEELNARANQLAHFLRGRGVGSDAPVGICTSRSLEMMVGVLGILKAGSAYLPLAPGTPTERLAYMLEESGATVVLTQSELAETLPPHCGRLIYLDTDWPSIARQGSENLSIGTQSTDLAYLMFTSGSTGKPKGVEIEHHSVVNFLTSMKQVPGIAEDDVLLAVTTLAFDISVLELFLPLSVGAKVVIVSAEQAADGLQLARVLSESGTTIMQATPASWRLLVEAGWQGDERLTVLCGGEAMPRDLAERLLNRCGALWNMYGPTETTIWSAVDRVQREEGPVSIGRPIANTQIYILDAHMQPVPVGVAGDLYIAGDGVGRGYLHREALTAERFVRDPFSGDATARMYRTGDLARYRTDGRIEFLGRQDFQVKVRGHRIELGEIELALNVHPSLQQSVVMARQAGPHLDDKRLVAYFIPNADARPKANDLRDHLKETLPDYMIPSTFVSMDGFPLNAAGKVDRKSLPEPDNSRPDLKTDYVAPRTEIERDLATIWAQVLSLDNVGVQDNFFDLGGASLQSLEVSTLAGQRGFEIEPAMLFQYPTVAELAAAAPKRIAEAPPASNNGNGRTPRIAPLRTGPAARSPSENGDSRRHATTIIESLGMYLPENVVDSDEIVRGCRNPLDFPLQSMTGIRNRRIADPDEYSIDLARKAVKECLRRSRNQPEHIDLLICCNISRYDGPDHGITFEPSTAVRLKHEFGFSSALALDMSNACAGFFTAIKVVDALVSCGAATRAMVVSGEFITHLTRTAQLEIEGFLDQRLAGLTLGDSGLAAILERSPSPAKGFQDLEMYTLGEYSSLCIAKATDQSHGGAVLINDAVKGTAVALSEAVTHAQQVLGRNGWSNGQMDHLIMHQTSQTTLDGAVEKLNATFNATVCHPGNTVYNIAERGNTATTTHLVALVDKILAGEIKSDSNVVFAISGSGQTVGTALYRMDDLPDRIRDDRPAAKRNGVCTAEPSAGPTGIRVESVGVVPAGAEIDRDTRSLLKAAGQACFDRSVYSSRDIELVLHAGIYRTDYICEPALATMVAGDFGMNSTLESPAENRTFAFDVMNGSVGFLNACYLATRMMQADRQQAAMVITSEVDNNVGQTDTTGIEQTGSALILEQADDPNVGFCGFLFRSFAEHVERYTSKTQWANGRPRLDFQRDRELDDIYLHCIPDVVAELLRSEGLEMSDICHILPPQISTSFIAALATALGVDRDRMIDATVGLNDLTTNSIPYALDALQNRPEAKSGERCLIISAGSGVEIGCALYRL